MGDEKRANIVREERPLRGEPVRDAPERRFVVGEKACDLLEAESQNLVDARTQAFPFGGVVAGVGRHGEFVMSAKAAADKTLGEFGRLGEIGSAAVMNAVEEFFCRASRKGDVDAFGHLSFGEAETVFVAEAFEKAERIACAAEGELHPGDVVEASRQGVARLVNSDEFPCAAREREGLVRLSGEFLIAG